MIADDAVQRRAGPGKDAGMARPRIGRSILIVTIVCYMTFPKQPFESCFAHVVPIAIKIVIAHLVHGNAYHEARAWLGEGIFRKNKKQERGQEDLKKAHGGVSFFMMVKN